MRGHLQCPDADTPHPDRPRVEELTLAWNHEHGTAYTVDQMINAYALAHPRTDLLAVGAITPEQVRRTVGPRSSSTSIAERPVPA